ncbi:putative baseplate assembly protein [Paraburkholderia terrae]|uniref:putative baseplate assembly protein n=1 Tax=Paraburkholderia terrae TaxID=311230 RepID=UPI00296B0EC0|nr:putative baseplate assembly protein [Paraburkholderia terrae]MDW3660607.1 putative baseplate assembly protein [Paraburkholderia terrae]
MKKLAPDLFQRRFDDLMEIGRARLPEYAPLWTDHNAHDPGITLMELLAWIAEAQLYSLSRMRRDERSAYASLLGIAPEGTQAARGMIWQDHNSQRSPVATYSSSVVISADAAVNVVDTDTPIFHPAYKLLWVPGQIARLESRLGDGRIVNLSVLNTRGGAAFLPFGEAATRRDTLMMTFRCRGDSGLFPVRREEARGARWPIGVRAIAPLAGPGAEVATFVPDCGSSIAATLVADGERIPLAILSDTTNGLYSTGVFMLDLDNVTGSPRDFTLELRPVSGLARPPRLMRIEPNVLPIVQGRFVERELHVSNGQPNFTFDLDLPSLSFGSGAPFPRVEVRTGPDLREWTRCDDLSEHGPDDYVYELDADAGRIAFGNGLNGFMPETEAQIFVSYLVSDGEQGIVARNRQWRVEGFADAFGVNPDPVTGGAAPSGWIDQRRIARRRARAEHALVSSDDIVAAALALPLLEVARAWVRTVDATASHDGTLILVAMRARAPDTETQDIPETGRWLQAIRRRLEPRMLLGTRLVVVAPPYVPFSIRATFTAEPGYAPSKVKAGIELELNRRLALVDVDNDMLPRQPGVAVTRRDFIAWLRKVEGVRQVIVLQLMDASGNEVENEIAVPRGGLPRFRLDRSTIEVSRAASGSSA